MMLKSIAILFFTLVIQYLVRCDAAGGRNFHSDASKRSTISLAADETNENYNVCTFEGDCAKEFLHNFPGKKFDWTPRDADRNWVDRLQSNGKFLVATIKKNYARNDFAMVSSAEFSIVGLQQCVSFRYYMYDKHGCDAGRLSVMLKCEEEEEEEEVLFQESRSSGKKWINQMLDINKPVGSKCKLHWKAAKGLNEEGQLGIDEIEVYNEACPKNDVRLPSALGCAFQGDICDWKNDGDLEWKYSDYKTNTDYTGPPDVYEGRIGDGLKGKYIYVDASDSVVRQQTFLVSPTVQTAQAKCMSLLINMNGEDVDKLQIFVNNKLTVTVEGDQKEKWFRKMIDIPQNTPTQVKIEASIGKGPRGDIAIDDVIVQDGTCDSLKVIDICSFAKVASTGELQHTCYVVKESTGCKSAIETATVQGSEVNTVRVTTEGCNNKKFSAGLFISGRAGQHKGCFQFNYKINDPSKSCHINVYQSKLDPSSEWKPTKTHELPELQDVKEGVWATYQQDVSVPFQSSESFSLTVDFKPNHDCKDISFANMELRSGPCENNNIKRR